MLWNKEQLTCERKGIPKRYMRKQTTVSTVTLYLYSWVGYSSTRAVSTVCTEMHSVPSPSSISIRKNRIAHTVAPGIFAMAAGNATNARAVPGEERFFVLEP